MPALLLLTESALPQEDRAEEPTSGLSLCPNHSRCTFLYLAEN